MIELFKQLFSAEGLQHLIQAGGLPTICLIVFLETGVFALLPGDSLLVLCGILAATPGADGQPLLSLPALLTLVPACAVLGDQTGYWVGKWAGRTFIYGLKDRYLGPIPLFKKSYLERTEAFYTRFGNFTIVAGRWVPFVRTFAPLLAGVVKMPFGTFLTYNVLGALSWVYSMVLAGYFLPPLLARIVPGFDLAKNIDKIAVAIVFLSLIPIVLTVRQDSRERKRAEDA